jgi:hypothetical protein
VAGGAPARAVEARDRGLLQQSNAESQTIIFCPAVLLGGVSYRDKANKVGDDRGLDSLRVGI